MNDAMQALQTNTPEQNLRALRRAYQAGAITDEQIAEAVRALQVLARAVEIGTALKQRASATLN